MAGTLGLQAVHLGLGLGKGGLGRLPPGPALGHGPAEVGVPLGLQKSVLGLEPLQLPPGLLGQTEGLGLAGQGLLHVGQLLLQPGDQAGLVVLPAVEPVPQAALYLGVGHILLPAGGQGGDAGLQGGGAVDGRAPLAHEGGALEYLPGHAGEGLPRVVPGEAGHRLRRAGIHRLKAAKGGAPLGPPAEGDGPALPEQLHAPLHGRAAPGLVAVLLREVALTVPLLGVDPVEHGPQEGRPGGLAPLVGGLNDIQPLPQRQLRALELAEGGAHLQNLHRQGSSPFSRAASPKRAASSSPSPSSAPLRRVRRNRPVRLSSPDRAHSARRSRV